MVIERYAKNNANQTLSTLDNLNNAQKGAVTGTSIKRTRAS